MGEWRGVELSGLTLAEPRPGGLRLRPYRERDVLRAFDAMQDRSMHEFLPLPDPYTEADARQFCLGTAPGKAARGEGVELAMVGPDDVLIGGAGLTLPGPRDTGAEIGYSVRADARGRGHATRAARLLAAWAFAHGVVRVEIRAAVGNIASQRAALRAGFAFEGVRRHEVLTPGGPVDGAVFSRLPRDPGEPVPPWLPPLVDVGDDVVLLRPIGPDDHAAVAAELADPTAQRWLVGPPPRDPAAAARSRAAAAGLGWLAGPSALVAVVDRAGGEVAGHLQVRSGPPGVLELGYGILPEFRGRGLTVRALRLFAAWAFGAGGQTRLELGADAENTASLVVAERAGFRREGEAPRRLHRTLDDVVGTEVRFGLTR